MHRSFRWAGSWTAAALVLVLVLAACGSGASALLSTVGNSVGPAPGAGGAPNPAPGAGAEDTSGSGGGDGPNAAIRDGAKIVYTGSLSLQVSDLDRALDAARQVVATLGGYVGASRRSNDGDHSVAEFTYRIPADRWEEALAAVRGLGSVVGEESDAADVTAQIVDLEARIRNLRASETALQRIAEQATRVEDILDVERRLTEIRGQIEQLDAQRAHFEDQAAYATLTVTFGTEVVAVVEAARGWDAAQEVDRATATLVDVLQALTTAGIWFAIVWLPLLVALLVMALIGRLVLRRVGILQPASRSIVPEG